MQPLQLIADKIRNLHGLIEEYNSYDGNYMRCTSDDEGIFHLVINGVQITTGTLDAVYKRVKGICKEHGIL